MAEGEAEPEAAAPEAAAPEEPNEPAGSGSEEEGPAPEPEPTPEEKGGWLLEAAKAGNKEETSRLVLDSEAGEFMQHTDRQGWTPLLWAACNGHMECVTSLVEHGAAGILAPTEQADAEGDDVAKSPNKHDASPVRPRKAPAPNVVNSPLHWSSYKGHLHIVFKLLLHNVCLTDVDEQGNSALALAAAGGDMPTFL